MTPVEHHVRTKCVARAGLDAITLAYDDSRAGQFNRAVVFPALAVPEFVLRLTIQFLSLQCSDMLHVHAVILWCYLAHDDSRAESRPGRAVAVCPALAVPEFVKRLTIHFVCLQCYDMLHVHAELPQCHLGI